MSNERFEFSNAEPYLAILGIVQDAGYPQAGCSKKCCQKAWEDDSSRRMVSCLGLADPESNRFWLFDATPDMKDQMTMINRYMGNDSIRLPAGIFLTHGHVGHYTGLMELGYEIIGASDIPVYAMPRMVDFLSTNGPWDQLVNFGNIKIVPIQNKLRVNIGGQLSVLPIEVPHRDEYTETVGYIINGKNKRVLFIPDIDKWDRWEMDINDLIQEVDLAFLDGTFFQNGEVPNRDMSEILHPFIEESMHLFESLSERDKQKIHFIHFNHTNPVLWDKNNTIGLIRSKGFRVAQQGDRIAI